MSSWDRSLLARATSVREEAQAYLRGRKAGGQPFARVTCADGRSVARSADDPEGRALFRTAAELHDLSRR
ncbi:MAG: hypothetical protein ACR2NA_12785 [Solirubrobacterales bacterium]